VRLSPIRTSLQSGRSRNQMPNYSFKRTVAVDFISSRQRPLSSSARCRV
jgi:hypothetical protein